MFETDVCPAADGGMAVAGAEPFRIGRREVLRGRDMKCRALAVIALRHAQTDPHTGGYRRQSEPDSEQAD